VCISPVNCNEEISMKKTFLTCMAVLALFAIAGSAGAITCTIDQRPAATLLVPRFAVSLNADATIQRGTPQSVDTLLAIGNASIAPMIAHVSVFNRRSTLVLDFNVALTGFDIQTWRMSDVLEGTIPSTPVSRAHVPPDPALDPLKDACQRNLGGTVGGVVFPAAAVYPDPNGYLRVRPVNPTTPDDNVLATTSYPVPAYDPNGAFAQQVIDSLDDTDDSLGCLDDSVDGVTVGNAVGYVTIDHANYCNLSNPSDPNYYAFDALGNENSLYGDIIFMSGEGIGTYGMAMVAIESDPQFAVQDTVTRARTFYARYWDPATEPPCQNCADGPDGSLNNLATRSPWNVGFGDQREPLGLKWAVRYFTNPNVISLIDVWRGSSGLLVDLTGPIGTTGDTAGLPLCTRVEPTVQLNFFDEDENGVSQVGPGPCPSPCSTPPPPTFNFPLETNRRAVTEFTLPTPVSGVNAGWISMAFNNTTTGTNLDQAFAAYEFDGGSAFISAHWPGWQLDPSACEPLGVIGVQPEIPTITGGVTGTGDGITIPPAGTGP